MYLYLPAGCIGGACVHFIIVSHLFKRDSGASESHPVLSLGVSLTLGPFYPIGARADSEKLYFGGAAGVLVNGRPEASMIWSAVLRGSSVSLRMVSNVVFGGPYRAVFGMEGVGSDWAILTHVDNA